MEKTKHLPALARSGTSAAGPAAEAVAARLGEIIQSCAGFNVESDGVDLWFDIECDGKLQVRLSGDRDGECYDRSASFAISYGGQPSTAPVSSRFRTVVEQIKAIDASRLPEVASAFGPAALALARSLASGAADGPPASRDEPARPSEEVAGGAPLGSESRVGRALNVVFLDLCLRLGADAPEALRPMHFGYWPSTTAASARTLDSRDPQEAFSIHLLSHVPDGVTRILDVGCGLGCNARILSARGKRVTAVSPVPHHCAVIENAQLPNVDVRCARFEDMAPEDPFDLLLFSESVNHFLLNDAFMRHCCRFLTESGFMLMADDLSAASVRRIEEQQQFRVVHASDITDNVASTDDLFARHLPIMTAYQHAMMATLELYDSPLATRVRTVLDSSENSDLKALFAGTPAPPAPKGRYMIFLLQRATPAMRA